MQSKKVSNGQELVKYEPKSRRQNNKGEVTKITNRQNIKRGNVSPNKQRFSKRWPRSYLTQNII